MFLHYLSTIIQDLNNDYYVFGYNMNGECVIKTKESKIFPSKKINNLKLKNILKAKEIKDIMPCLGGNYLHVLL